MIRPPILLGKSMKPAHQNGRMWCARGVWLVGSGTNWNWEIAQPIFEFGNKRRFHSRGNASRRWTAIKQIERAIARIRSEAKELGT